MTFKILEKIGEGNFGSVFRVSDDKNNEFAFKAIPASKLKYIELDILNRLKCPYIIRIVNPKTLSFNNRSGILVDLKEDNLSNLNTKELPYIQLKRIIISSIYGLKCMHKKGYLHLDINKKNILYNKDNEDNYLGYISDFGWSLRCDDAYKGIMSDKTIKYKNIPAENIIGGDKRRKYSDKTDIMLMGIVILEILGSKINFFESGEHTVKINNINDSFIEEKIRLYNNKKMSYNEEIYLKELLLNMLKLNSQNRISSKDITKLKFFQSQNRLLKFSDECVLEKPTEFVFMPYTSPLTKEGIKKLNSFYMTESKQNKNITIDEYFLSIQIFLRLMSKIKPSLDDNEFNKLVQDSIDVASNYYDRQEDGDYQLIKDLNNDIGYNYYYCAKYLDDLIILNHYLVSGNEHLLGFYNLLNIRKVFDYFREKYIYQYQKKDSKTLYEFLNEEIPNKNDDDEVDFITSLDYHEIISDEEITPSSFKNYKKLEKEFRSDIIDKFEDRIIKTYQNDDLNIVDYIDNIIKQNKFDSNYKKFKKNLTNKNILSILKDINLNFSYGIINIFQDNDLDINKEDINKYTYFIVNNNEKYSLIRLDKQNKKIIHYYSQKINKIEEYFINKGYIYENNFEYGINSCCKILEICLIFIIYYNLKTDSKDYHLKCLDNYTIKSILMALMV